METSFPPNPAHPSVVDKPKPRSINNKESFHKQPKFITDSTEHESWWVEEEERIEFQMVLKS